MILTYKYRIKDATAGKHLRRHAIACNQVWNFCVATQREAERRWKAGRNVRWPTAFDLIKLCSDGVAAELGINSQTIREICRYFCLSRNNTRKVPRFRSSFGPKKALGWVPFSHLAVKVKDDHVIYLYKKFFFWHSRPIDGRLTTGAFAQDARGRWYVTFQCEAVNEISSGNGQVGIDLGLKSVATLSDGTTIPALRHYRRYEAALAVASRANNKRRVRAIHAKIANSRRHHLHEWSTKIARENSFIAVGNVSPTQLAKTRMAKSITDAGWGILRAQLRYKARRHGATFIEVDEAYTSQTCSSCGARPEGRPKGIAGLGIRHWECSNCGASHDRDVNAAQNILRVGLERQPPAEEIAPLREDVKS